MSLSKIRTILKKAPLHVLQEAVAEPRPTYWTCRRCGGKIPSNKLRCEGPEGHCGLGTKLQATDGPEIWDLVQEELKRRGKKTS